MAARDARAEAAAESLRGEAESAAEALGAVVSDGFVGYVREQVLADMGVGVSERAGGVVGGDDEGGFGVCASVSVPVPLCLLCPVPFLPPGG